jgi:dCTP deaminase
MEELSLPAAYWAKANPKSSTGRVDVFTRLIADYATEFERVPPGYKGWLYLEIVPRTFSVVVRQGVRLSQLRFWRGTPVPSDKGLTELHEAAPVVYLGDQPAEPVIAKGLWVTVDLASGEGQLVGYRAKRHAPPLDLSLVRHYETLEYWDPVYLREPRHLVLDPDEFYILASKQRVAIPPSFAADMVGYDPSVGEFRVHYAGFFDPGFGFGPDGSVRGAHAVLEVRSHEVPFLLEDDQRVARLVFERLQAPPDKIYGGDIGSSYQGQALALSKHFK